MRKLFLLAFVVACGGAWAREPTATELKGIAESIRPALIESLGPYIATPTLEQSVCVGIDACAFLTTGKGDTVVGACAGRSLLDGSWNVLVGDHTATPTPHTSNFVNIGNRLCFWRDTGARVACPPPEPDCFHPLS